MSDDMLIQCMLANLLDLRAKLDVERRRVMRYQRELAELPDMAALEKEMEDANFARWAQTVRRAAHMTALLKAALLAAEWGGETEPSQQGCDVCGRRDRYEWQTPAHCDGCPVDAALRAVGLETQQQRNDARKSLTQESAVVDGPR